MAEVIAKNEFLNYDGLAYYDEKLKSDYNKKIYGYSGDDLLIIPDGTETISFYKYERGTFKCVIMPDSVTTIEQGAFSNCVYLEHIVLSKNLTFLGSQTFAGCGNLKNLILPDGLTHLHHSTITSSHNLEIIDIPESVETYGELCIYPSGVNKIIIRRETPGSGDHPLGATAGSCKIFVPAQSVDKYKGSVTWGPYSDNIFPITEIFTDNVEINNNLKVLGKIEIGTNNGEAAVKLGETVLTEIQLQKILAFINSIDFVEKGV